MDQLTFERENHERIQAVENSFGPSGKSLSKPGRFLIGEGRLMKRCRKKWKPKAFFLFNDILMYGSAILDRRWYQKQKIIPLEDIQVEDMEDGMGANHQWLIRTPSKSFFVSSLSLEEKQTWIKHIKGCRSSLLHGGGCQPGTTFAVSWIPDQAAEKCMRCFSNFTATKRRHHCRKCGFLVCNLCSKKREVIGHIHPTKQLRICNLCHTIKTRGDRTGKDCSDEEEQEGMQTNRHSCWLDSERGSWGHMFT
ncbi:pleckstrin homology domain-containing family F member 1-like [Brachyistius frenatus]|uniref:pleckstrin homology domain-containing family F member 1-like n=1 Tax=Brachyistius frenatus TaxID=100188 RepID=UPI0037E7F438